MARWRQRLLSTVLTVSTGGLLVVAATPASAEGCQDFGRAVAAFAQQGRAFGEVVSSEAAVADEVLGAQEEIC